MIRREIVCDAVDEILLGGIAGEVGERQHDDGEMRGLGGPRRGGGDRRGTALEGDISRAASNGGEGGDSRDCRDERRALIRLGRRWRTHLQRISLDRLGDVLESRRPEIDERQIETTPHLSHSRYVSGTSGTRFPLGEVSPGAIVSQVARRHGATPQRLFTWRREARSKAQSSTLPAAFRRLGTFVRSLSGSATRPSKAPSSICGPTRRRNSKRSPRPRRPCSGLVASERLASSWRC